MAKLWAISLVFASTLLTSTAQILYKLGAEKLNLNLASLLTNLPLFAGLFLYGIGGILMIISFRGGEVSTLYPVIATSYIWVGFLAVFFLGETMNLLKWAGIFAIFLGVALTSQGGKN